MQILAEYEKELRKQQAELLARIEQRRVERLAEAGLQPDGVTPLDGNEFEVEDTEKAPVGPGGLDPTEVLNSLPREMAECFVSRDIPALQRVLEAMPSEQAAYHMRRCVDSGLWVTDATQQADDDADTEDPE